MEELEARVDNKEYEQWSHSKWDLVLLEDRTRRPQDVEVR